MQQHESTLRQDDIESGSTPKPAKQYEGVGGWLILVAIILISSVITIIAAINQNIDLLVSGNQIFNRSSNLYIPHYFIFVLTETIIYGISFLLAFYITSLFFSKNYKFPKWFVWLYPVTLFSLLVKILIYTNLNFPQQLALSFKSELPGLYLRFVAVGIWTAIWFEYMRKSNRVKNTFTEKKFAKEKTGFNWKRCLLILIILILLLVVICELVGIS